MNTLFIHGPSRTLRLLVLVALSIATMVLDHQRHHLDVLRSTLTVVVYPLRYLVDLPFSAGHWLSESLSTRSELLNENSRLHEEALILKARLQRLYSLEAENSRLRGLLESSSRVRERILIAELLAVDLAPFSRHIILDKGELHGVYPGQAIIDANGIMGQIIEVSPLQSTAVLITDPNHTIPVEVNRNGLRTIASGMGEINRLSLAHLPNNADILVGDLLVSSGLGGRFPAGYPVARVSLVNRSPDSPFAHVEADPLASLESSREVLLLWKGAGHGPRPVAPTPPVATQP